MIRQSISLVLLLALFVGCKKHTEDPPVEMRPSDLLGYHIVIEGKNKGLQVFYFVENNGTIEAYRDNRTSRRVRNLSSLTKEGDYSFDVDNNGEIVFTFKFQKNRQGKVSLASSHYKTGDNAENQIEHIQLVESNTIGAVIGKAYIFYATPAPYLDYVKFTTGVTIEVRYNTAPTTNSYEIEQLPTVPATIGWKTKIENSDYLGVFVNEWKTEKGPLMLMQMNGQHDDIIWLFKEAG